jgi:hypothetical protein
MKHLGEINLCACVLFGRLKRQKPPALLQVALKSTGVLTPHMRILALKIELVAFIFILSISQPTKQFNLCRRDHFPALLNILR